VVVIGSRFYDQQHDNKFFMMVSDLTQNHSLGLRINGTEKSMVGNLINEDNIINLKDHITVFKIFLIFSIQISIKIFSD
jgi:hypothetical protein